MSRMYSKFSEAVKAVINFDSEERNAEIERIRQEDHSYERVNVAHRAPCPGLNALANQGYLPRDGSNITLPQLEAALMVALHMTGTLAHSLANSAKSLVRENGTFDLSDTRMHNALEHDRSLARLDYRHGDNYTLQPAMLQAMLDDACDGPVTLKTMAVTYNRRKKEHNESGGQSLGLRLWFTNLLMTASFINTEGTGHPSQDQVRQFNTEERFQDYILENPEPRTLRGLLSKSAILLWHTVF